MNMNIEDLIHDLYNHLFAFIYYLFEFISRHTLERFELINVVWRSIADFHSQLIEHVHGDSVDDQLNAAPNQELRVEWAVVIVVVRIGVDVFGEFPHGDEHYEAQLQKEQHYEEDEPIFQIPQAPNVYDHLHFDDGEY
jgi:hypothetical protein